MHLHVKYYTLFAKGGTVRYVTEGKIINYTERVTSCPRTKCDPEKF
jgi:hypothetical protein